MVTAAVIDVGSNAVRMAMVQIDAVGQCQRHRFDRFAVRLGADSFSPTREIGPELRRQLLAALKAMTVIIEAEEIDCVRAVATDAMRQAANGDQLCQEILHETGIGLEIISGTEEAAWSRQALISAMGWVAPDTIFVDLGGGSLELSMAGDVQSISVPLGTVRLLEKFPVLRQPLNTSVLAAVRQQIATLVRQHTEHMQGGHMAVGTGGTFETLSRLLSRTTETASVEAIVVDKLWPLIERLAPMSVSERIAIFGLKPDRADVIVPAAIIILEMMQCVGAGIMLTPGKGLREGILADLVCPVSRAQEWDAWFQATVVSSTKSQQPVDEILALALGLFRALRTRHHLWPLFEVLLRAHCYLKETLQCCPGASLKKLMQRLNSPQLSELAEHVLLQSLEENEAIAASLSPVLLQRSRLVAAIIALAEAMAAAGVVSHGIRADIMAEPMVLYTQLSPRQCAALQMRLQDALGRKVVLRA